MFKINVVKVFKVRFILQCKCGDLSWAATPVFFFFFMSSSDQTHFLLQAMYLLPGPLLPCMFLSAS